MGTPPLRPQSPRKLHNHLSVSLNLSLPPVSRGVASLPPSQSCTQRKARKAGGAKRQKDSEPNQEEIGLPVVLCYRERARGHLMRPLHVLRRKAFRPSRGLLLGGRQCRSLENDVSPFDVADLPRALSCLERLLGGRASTSCSSVCGVTLTGDGAHRVKNDEGCRQANKPSRVQERMVEGNKMACKRSWSKASGNNFGSGVFVQPLIMESSLWFSVSYSSGAAPDVSFDGSPCEAGGRQIEKSVNFSDRSKLGDRSLKLLSGSCYLPHPDKEETGGEDAHFIWDEQAIGVADGVGGWADLGVDAGQYARELMSHSVSAILEEPKGSIDPARVLEKAYKSTKAKGSSTACIIALTAQGIHAINLGDSGFIVVRDGCTICRSPVQQHDFNFTYQLESGNSSDLPSSAQVFTVPVASGDVIVAGTDGLFDNLYNNEITAVVVHAIRTGLEPQVMAQKLAALARQRAQDRNRQTPFSSAAQEAGYRYYGGKLDDITVVVSYITAFGT